MSGLRVLIVLGSLPDLLKMFNSIIGTFHHTCAATLLRSSLAGIRLLRGLRGKIEVLEVQESAPACAPHQNFFVPHSDIDRHYQ
jgi:hypothetical protein